MATCSTIVALSHEKLSHWLKLTLWTCNSSWLPEWRLLHGAWGLMRSSRYTGPGLSMSRATLYLMHCSTGSQCNSLRMGVMWQILWWPVTIFSLCRPYLVPFSSRYHLLKGYKDSGNLRKIIWYCHVTKGVPKQSLIANGNTTLKFQTASPPSKFNAIL